MEPTEEFLGGTQKIVIVASLIFLGVVFLLGVIVNIPAGVIYLRSRQLKGFVDKFILFILISDVITLFTFIPISFLSVLEIWSNLEEGAERGQGAEEERPMFSQSESDDVFPESKDLPSVPTQDFLQYCVQQWIFIGHRFLLVLSANLAVLGAVKIALERYLAVLAPLHYHKILKPKLIFVASFTSSLVSIAFAVLAIMDPEHLHSAQVASQCAPKSFQGTLPWSSSTTVELKEAEVAFIFASDSGDEDRSTSQSAQESQSAPWWWSVLKVVHALMFFALPVISMIYMYLRIWSEARKQNKRMAYHNKNAFILPTTENEKKTAGGINAHGLHQILSKFKLVQRIKRKAKMDRAARVALLTIGLLTLCFGMLYFVQTVEALSTLVSSHFDEGMWNKSSGERNSSLYSFLLFLLPTLLASLHPVLSPLVYVYRYRRVRTELKLLLKSLISKLLCSNCCCTDHDLEQGALAPKCPSESQNSPLPNSQSHVLTTTTTSSDSRAELGFEADSLESVLSDSAFPESDLEEGIEYHPADNTDTSDCERSSITSSSFFQLFNCFMSSYSSRWSQHRDSVTSTASFITLLSTRSKSIPSTEI